MKRYNDIVFGQKSTLLDFKPLVASFGSSVTDDSHFVPRVKQVRDFVASGGTPSGDLRYDSQESDDGSVQVPVLNRSVPIDPVDADAAIQSIVNDAIEKQSKAQKEADSKALKESLQKQSDFIDGVKQSLSDSSDS